MLSQAACVEGLQDVQDGQMVAGHEIRMHTHNHAESFDVALGAPD